MEEYMQTTSRSVYIIGVAGGTASGKTTMAKTIIDKVGHERVSYIEYDWYYKDLSYLPIEERLKTNFDHPDALETELLVDHLKQLRSGNTINAPQYDFKTCTRQTETIKIEPRDVVIIDGVLALSSDSLRELYDLKIFVDLDADERLTRRLARDVKERGRTFESIISQYLTTVKPMHDQFVAPWKQEADIVVPGGASRSRALDTIAGQVYEKIERSRASSGLRILQSIGSFKPIEGSQSVLRQIVEIAAKEMNADNVTLHQYDSVSKQFLDPQRYSATWPEGSSLQRPREQGYSFSIISEGSLYVGDVDSDKTIEFHPTAHLQDSGTKSFLGVRLDAGGDSVGVIFFNYLKTRKIDEKEREWAFTISNYAAVTIQIARLYEQRQKFITQLRDLSNVGARLLAANPSAMKDIIVKFARDEFGADSCTLHQFDSNRGEFLDPEIYSSASPMMGNLEKPRGEGASSVVIRDGTLIISDIATYDSPSLIQTAHLEDIGVRAFIGIRLELGQEVLGVLFLNYLTPQKFDDDQESLVKVLSIYASAAILSVRSHLRVIAEQQKENLLIVQEMSNALELHASLPDFLQALLEQTLSRIDAPKGTIQLFNAESQQLEIYAEKGLEYKKRQSGIYPHQGITGRAFREKQFIYIDDTQQSEEFIPFLGQMRSEMAMPIVIGDKGLGVFNAEHQSPRAFAEDKIELFKLICAQASIIIDQKLKIEDEINKRNAAEQKALLTNIVRDTQHHIGNKVSMIQIRATELFEDSELDLSPEQQKKLKIILTSADAALKASKYILDSRKAPTPDWVSPYTLMDELEALSDKLQEVPLGINLPEDLPLIYADFERTKYALKDLVTNAQRAVLAIKNSGYVRITAKLANENRYVEFMFSNNGKSIEKEKWDAIFKGPGFGLPTARELMANQSGSIEVSQSNSRQTTFVVKFLAK
jgi:uridine kinase